MNTFVHLWQYLAEFFLEWEIFQLNHVDKTNILFSVTFFRKSCRLWDTVEKYGGTREATDALCMLDIFSTATLVTQMRLDVML
jgi:hypothetical protein